MENLTTYKTLVWKESLNKNEIKDILHKNKIHPTKYEDLHTWRFLYLGLSDHQTMQEKCHDLFYDNMDNDLLDSFLINKFRSDYLEISTLNNSKIITVSFIADKNILNIMNIKKMEAECFEIKHPTAFLKILMNLKLNQDLENIFKIGELIKITI